LLRLSKSFHFYDVSKECNLAITASSGNVSARIEARRPSWTDMEKSYPGRDIKTAVLYDLMIGGRFKGLYQHSAYQNTCAVRMSYALNRSGLRLSAPPSPGGAIEGGDGYLYWIRVSDLTSYLIKRFGGADEELRLPLIPATLVVDTGAMATQFKERVRLAKAWLETRLHGRKGIVVFDVSGWGDASGHFTLWNGASRKLAYAESHDDPENNMYYFWLTHQATRTDGTTSLVQLVSAKFWELK
jgi:hypothetical protein